MSVFSAPKGQRGINVVSLIVWIVLAVIIMGGVVHLFSETSKQTAIGAEKNQQQSSILEALNRTSRDVTVSNPIVYLAEDDLIMDVTLVDGTVERRRYFLNDDDAKVYEFSKDVKRGDSYDPADAAYWENNVNRKATTVYNVDLASEVPFFEAFDRDGKEITGPISSSKSTEAIARVDISLTADVANKGKVSLSTSAVPQNFSGLSGEGATALPTCPAFTVTRDGDSVVARWGKVEGATSYEVTRNGILIPGGKVEAGAANHAVTDKPGASSSVVNYMLKVVGPAGITNCLDSVTPVVIAPTATQLTVDLLPTTSFNAEGTPVATDWKKAGEVTTVELKWQKVSIATGYVLYKQVLNSDGSPKGERVEVVTFDQYPYVDLNSETKAPATLSHKVSTDWDEYSEWSIKILSRTGDNDSTPEVRTLSYPAPVKTVKASAKPVAAGDPNRVPLEDLKAGNGHTAVQWEYTNGFDFRGFDVYRSAMDANGSFIKIGSVENDVRNYVDTKAELGSTYFYYVVAKNKSGFSNNFDSAVIKQLQYPADPALKPLGVDGTRDLDGNVNVARWNASKSASKYTIFRDGKLAGTTTGVEFFDRDAAVKPATRFHYVVVATNATGDSPKLFGGLTVTQRPAVPALNVTEKPSLTSKSTGLKWNHTAGSWCVNGAYKAAGDNCEYQQVQYNNDGSVRKSVSMFNLSMAWGNQDWGRNYSYDVRARNAAITNDGWSGVSNREAVELYPGPVAVQARNGDVNGNAAQRIVYSSSRGNGGWGDVDVTGHTTMAWGGVEGARALDVARVSDGWQATSHNPALRLPSEAVIYGRAGGDAWGVRASHWTLIAAPGAAYRYDITAKSLENDLERRVSSNTTITPADVPQAGAVKVVCSGPGNGDGTGLRDHAGQKITNRLDYSNVNSRYGYFDTTAIQKLYTPYKGAGLTHNGWVDAPKGSNVNGLDASHGVGYFHNIESGFTLTNKANGRTPSATLGAFTNSSIYTYDGCPRGAQMEEPSDACYVNTFAGCTALNPEQRPKWLSR